MSQNVKPVPVPDVLVVDLPPLKPRFGVLPSKVEVDRSKPRRHPKHKGQETVDALSKR